MSWQVILVLSSLLGILRDSFTKRITQKINPLIALFYFYITAFFAALAVSLIYYDTNPLQFDSTHWYARLFGVAFGIGVYGFFNAIKISLIKTQTFGNYRNLVSIILSFIFLGEISQLNVAAFVALLIFIVSLVLPMYGKKDQGEQVVNREWMWWMSLNILFIGSGLFFVKLLTNSLLPIDLLVNQYLGSFVTISIIIAVKKYGFKQELSLVVQDRKVLGLTLLNGVVTAFSLFFLYLAISLSGVSIVTQVDNFVRTLFIIPISFIIFKEYRALGWLDYISIVLAIIGAFILMFMV